MLAEAGSHGATTIALTSFPRSPLAEVADIVLLTATQATTFRPDALSARHPQLVVLDLLYIAVAQRTYERAHAAFQRHRAGGRRSPVGRGKEACRMTVYRSRLRVAIQAVIDRIVVTQAGNVSAGGRPLIVAALRAGGVLQAFGTGHSEAVAMEFAGRAGGSCRRTGSSSRDLVLTAARTRRSSRGPEAGTRSRDRRTGSTSSPAASRGRVRAGLQSGINGADRRAGAAVKQRGHKLIAMTSVEHTDRVTPSATRRASELADIADVVLDNGAPYGDAMLSLDGGGAVCAVSSVTTALHGADGGRRGRARIEARARAPRLPVRQRRRRGRAQPRPREPVRRTDPAHRLTRTEETDHVRTPSPRPARSRLSGGPSSSAQPSPASSPRPRCGLLAACADSGSDDDAGTATPAPPARPTRSASPRTSRSRSSSSTAASATEYATDIHEPLYKKKYPKSEVKHISHPGDLRPSAAALRRRRPAGRSIDNSGAER